MSSPEDIPEDKEQSYPCECGGSITLDEGRALWECDSCEFKKGNTDLSERI